MFKLNGVTSSQQYLVEQSFEKVVNDPLKPKERDAVISKIATDVLNQTKKDSWFGPFLFWVFAWIFDLEGAIKDAATIAFDLYENPSCKDLITSNNLNPYSLFKQSDPMLYKLSKLIKSKCGIDLDKMGVHNVLNFSLSFLRKKPEFCHLSISEQYKQAAALIEKNPREVLNQYEKSVEFRKSIVKVGSESELELLEINRQLNQELGNNEQLDRWLDRGGSAPIEIDGQPETIESIKQKFVGNPQFQLLKLLGSVQKEMDAESLIQQKWQATHNLDGRAPLSTAVAKKDIRIVSENEVRISCEYHTTLSSIASNGSIPAIATHKIVATHTYSRLADGPYKRSATAWSEDAAIPTELSQDDKPRPRAQLQPVMNRPSSTDGSDSDDDTFYRPN